MEQGGIRLSGNISGEGEVSLLLALEPRNVTYPLGAFPEIREFAAMVERMKAGETVERGSLPRVCQLQ